MFAANPAWLLPNPSSKIPELLATKLSEKYRVNRGVIVRAAYPLVTSMPIHHPAHLCGGQYVDSSEFVHETRGPTAGKPANERPALDKVRGRQAGPVEATAPPYANPLIGLGREAPPQEFTQCYLHAMSSLLPLTKLQVGVDRTI